MSRKNHQVVNCRLLQTDKPFSQLKQTQKEKINEWLYQEYRAVYQKVGKVPDARHNDSFFSVSVIKNLPHFRLCQTIS